MSYRPPAAPLSSENSRGPEVLRPRLTAGLPLSALGRMAEIHRIEVNHRRNHDLRSSPTSRGHHRPERRRRDYGHSCKRSKPECVANRGQPSSIAPAHALAFACRRAWTEPTGLPSHLPGTDRSALTCTARFAPLALVGSVPQATDVGPGSEDRDALQNSSRCPSRVCHRSMPCFGRVTVDKTRCTTNR